MTDKCENCLSKNVCRWYANGMGKNLCCADDFPCPEQKDKDLFIKLPCKVGDMVYKNNGSRIEKFKVARFIISSYGIRAEDLYGVQVALIDDFGKTVFLTKEEAEAELRERKEDEGK